MTSSEMTLHEHFVELRNRIISCLILIILGFILSMYWSDKLWEILLIPLQNNSEIQLINIAPTEALIIELKIAFFSSLLLTSPFCLWQAWRFIAPALNTNNDSSTKILKKSTPIKFISIACILCSLGCIFAFNAVLPLSFEFLKSYTPANIRQNWTQETYYSFIINMILIFAMIFQFPLVTWLLASYKFVSSKFWFKHLRLAIIIILILSALITPPDPLSMIVISIPMFLLYFLSAVIAYFAGKAQKDKVTND